MRPGSPRWFAPAVVATGLLMSVVACERDRGVVGRPPAAGARPQIVRTTDFVPGTVSRPVSAVNPYEDDGRALHEGTRLYQWFNCGGCHFEGGGGIGPPLMDTDWIYGERPFQIFDSIASGRPNGMPAYGDKLTEEQIWQITLYVSSLSEEADDRPRGRAPEVESPDAQ
jgi:cytochrome c oxidase cbb3-type subunit III